MCLKVLENMGKVLSRIFVYILCSCSNIFFRLWQGLVNDNGPNCPSTIYYILHNILCLIWYSVFVSMLPTIETLILISSY